MMQETQENLLEQSRQGDPEAIAALIDRSLQPKGIRTQAEIDEDCLHLFLEANQAPPQAQLVPFIRNGLTSLGVESIRMVRIYGRQKGQRQPIWQEAVDLNPANAFSVATVQQRLSTLYQPSSNTSGLNRGLDELGLEPSDNSGNGTVLQQEPIGGVVNGHHGATLVQPGNADGSEPYSGRPGVGQQIAIANKVMHLTDYGGVIDTTQTGGLRNLKLRPVPTPQRYCPPFPELLGRQVEVEAAIANLRSATSVEFWGETGLGKTSLLQAIAYAPGLANTFPDGIVYRHAYRQTVPDLLQTLLTDFCEYESSLPIKATETEIRDALQDKKALILLDDVQISREEVENLLNASPNLTFLLTGLERHLWSEGQAIPIPGLPLDDALTLLERGLGRPIEAQEHTPAAKICNVLGGHPLRILQVASLARHQAVDVNRPFDEPLNQLEVDHQPVDRQPFESSPLVAIAQQLQDSPSPEAMVLKASASLPQAERQALAALSVLGGVPARPENLAAVTRLPDVENTLRSLSSRGLALTDGNRYSIAPNLLAPLQRVPKRDQWINRILSCFTTWAEQHGQVTELAQESNVLLRMMQLGIETQRWPEVLRLAKAIDPALTLSGLWGAWEQALQWALQAGQALGDRASEAWAMHQLGTRALCLEDSFAAQSWLTQALEQRESLGDQPGTVATLHNLGLLLPPLTQVEPPIPVLEPEPEPIAAPIPTPTPLPTISSTSTPAPPWLKWAILAGLFAALGTLLALLFTSNRNSDLWLSRDRLDFDNQEQNTVSAVETVELENRDLAPLQFSRVAPTGADSEDFEVSENCTAAPIQPAAGCTVEVSFVPTDTGNRRANLTFYDAQGDRIQSIPLRGSGEEPNNPLISFNPNRLNFEAQDVGTQTPVQVITLENVSAAPVTFERIELAGPARADFQATENCTGLPIQPGVTCTIEASFAPTAVSDRAASLVIQSNTSDRPWAVPLRGFGNESAAAGSPQQGFSGSTTNLGVNPDSVDFGELRVAGANVAPQRVTETITLNNPGSAPIVMQELSLGGQNVDDFQSSTNCTNNTVAPNSSCTVEISFAPGAAGERVADLRIVSNAPNSIVSVRLGGTGVNAIPRVPRIALTPDELTFDAQETDPNGKVITIRNDGAIDLRVGNIAIAGNDPNYFALATRDNSINCANTVLAPGERCDVAIAFRGSGSDRTAELTVSSNAPNRIPSIRLIGRGSGTSGGDNGSASSGAGSGGGSGTPQAPRISVTPANLTFNTANSEAAISVTNNGTADLRLGNIAITGNNPDSFSSAEDNGLISCSNTVLAPGDRCDISILFAGSESDRAARLTIPSNASDRPIAVNLIGVGSSSGETPGATPSATPGETPAGNSSLSLSSPNLNFGTQPLLVTADQQVLTLTNTGSNPLEIGNIAFTGDPDFFALSASSGDTLECSYQSLEPGSSCQLTLGFTPFAAGDRTAQLTIPTNAPDGPVSVSLNGSGEPSGNAAVPSYTPYGR
ncbi:choice-of-anchor D domain-containing protein [Cyanobacteria bacterium FACHB-471]|nr:choice-of-anchor D domain-containing protein [Cyanobacteria bacterium FACHB-471]